MNYTHIFWDWNGTLLNDIDACIDSMNKMLSRRGMPLIDEKYYKSAFGFPVIEYYKLLGFDFSKESFETLSVEFISEYNSFAESSLLQPHAGSSLELFESRNYTQVVVSAMEQQMLESQIESRGIVDYFDSIIGLTDIYAGSKAHLAGKFIRVHMLNPSRIVFIGDTLHDAEVASHLGCDSFLVANGHHSMERLKMQNHQVVPSLKDLMPFFI